MRITVLLTIMLMMALPTYGEEDAAHTVENGEWFFIPVTMPKAKIGGGDFYNLQVELDGDEQSTEYEVVTGGVNVRSEDSGIFNVLLKVNHVSKSSCAGVEVNTVLDDTIQVNVTK